MLLGQVKTSLNSQDFIQQVAHQYKKETAKQETSHITETANGVSIDISEQAKELYREQEQKTLALMEELKAQKESGEKEAEAIKDMFKIFTIAARIAHGDKVPASDEKKLMEFDSDLYLASKSAGAISKNKKPKEYDSVFEEEKENESSVSGGEANIEIEETQSADIEVSETIEVE